MANLRGGTLEKQVSNAFYKLVAFSEKRHRKNDHQTHSVALSKKRLQALKDFANYLESEGRREKLNLAITEDTMNLYFEKRLKLVSKITAEDILRMWSSMLKGLKEKNITVNLEIDEYFNKKVSSIKDTYEDVEIKYNRAPKDLEKILQSMYIENFESGVIAEVQATLSFRISEAFEFVKNYKRYTNRYKINGIKGKGNHIYIEKNISIELLTKVKMVKKLPCQSTYRRHLKIVSNKLHVPHDFRYYFVKSSFENILLQGVSYSEALIQVSEQINHHRPDVTSSYLKKA